MIVAMKKATAAFFRDRLESVTEALQKTGEFMPTETEASTDLKAVNSPILCEEADTALKAYSKYRKSKSGSMLYSPTLYSEADFDSDSQADKTRVIKTVELYEQYNSINAQINSCDEERKGLLPYETLGIDASEQDGTRYTSLLLGRIPYSEKSKTKPALDLICEEYGLEYEDFYYDSGQKYFYTSVFKDDEAEVLQKLTQSGFERLRLPYRTGTGAEALEKNAEKKEQLEFLKNSVEEQLKAEAENAQAIELFYDKEKAKADRAEIPAETTETTVVLTGWVRSDKTKIIEKAVAEGTGGVYSIAFDDPGEDDEVPSVTKDPYLIDQYSTITNSYSPPGKNDIDPNPFMAPWYFMIFGMIIGDVGYGILIGIVLLIVKKIKRPTGDFAKLINVMLYSCIPAVFWGVMYGSYFGETWHPVLFSPLENILGAMILVLIVGVLHIFTGITIKAVMNFKAGRWLDAITDQIAWMALITGCGLLALEQTRTAGIIVAAVSVGVIVILGGHAKKTVFGKITGGVSSLTGITNYLSDILSYLRIFALALASGLIGMVMNVVANMIAGAVPVPVLNRIAAIPIYVIGHGLNTALSILGAYVHTGRLQFIEFFGKFYEGNGIHFRPMQRKYKYIQLLKNKK